MDHSFASTSGEQSGGKSKAGSQQAFLNGLITSLLENIRTEQGKVKAYDQIESEFCTAVGKQPIVFARYKSTLSASYALRVREIEQAAEIEHRNRLFRNSCAHIRNFETLLQATLFSESTSYGFAGNLKTFIGQCSPSLYFLLYLFLSASGRRRYNCDGLLSICLSGRSSLGESFRVTSSFAQSKRSFSVFPGKSRLLDVLLSGQSVKSISWDSPGVGRFQVDPSTTTLFYNDIKISDLVTQNRETWVN